MTRIHILHRLIAAGFILISSAVFYLQIIQSDKYQHLSQANRIRVIPESASRGLILDRNNNILAGNTLSYNLLITPQKKKDTSLKQISILAGILSIPEEDLKNKFKGKYIFPFVPILLCEDISLDKAVAVGQLKYDLTGVHIQVVSKRVYPLGSVASHLLGYIGQIDAWRLERLKKYGYKIQDLVGYSGIEEFHDYFLRSVDGGMQVEVDNKGRLVRMLGYKSAHKGKDVQLTIDLGIQKIVHDKLEGKTGSVVILDPSNGEIIALESYPNFDPQIFQDTSSVDLKRILNDPDAPLLNRAINGVYPPGSIFKVIVAAAGLEKKKISLDTSFICSKYIKIGNRKFACWDLHDQENIIDAIAHSCNVYFYSLGLRLGPQLINEYALKFGLGQRTGIDLYGESTGNIPYSFWDRIKKHRSWFVGDTANMSIGQGEILTTPLQLARMVAVFANSGKMVEPRLLKAIMENGRVLDSPKYHITNLMVSEGTIQIIKKGLSRTISEPNGTGNVLADTGIPVSGKTGTAQVSSGQPHGWFVGYFPVDNPKFVICSFLEHSGSGYRACQLTREIIIEMKEKGII